MHRLVVYEVYFNGHYDSMWSDHKTALTVAFSRLDYFRVWNIPCKSFKIIRSVVTF